MNRLDINWLEDTFDCEDCGWSYCEGAIVYLNGELFLELIPNAGCLSLETYNREDVYEEIIKKLGYKISSIQEN